MRRTALRVTVRVVLAVLGGYAFSALLSAALAVALARVFGWDRGEAVMLAAMLAFVVYLVVLLWTFTRPIEEGPPPTLRRSMCWLHTWAGVVLGSLLFAIFWMGTLSVFDREIDRWMMPATRIAAPGKPVSLDAAAGVAQRLAAGSPQWGMVLPTARAPTLELQFLDQQKEFVERHIDPRTGQVIEPQGTLAGTGFIFPFHFGLHLEWQEVGYWLVFLAGMAMLVLLVSGVVIHRRIFKDFFSFRPAGALSRGSLDLHNVTGVLLLPFHLVMTLSGLIIFFSIFFPGTWKAAYGGDERSFSRDAFGGLERPRANRPGKIASLDAMADEAARRWGGGRVYYARVRHPGDAASYVEMRRSYAHDLEMNRDQVYFDAATGAVLGRHGSKPVARVQRVISGIHFVQFENWTLRWLYFLAGLGGCVMIATGFIYWLETRRARHERLGLRGVRVVHALTVGSVTGIVAATLVFFVANRLLPLGAAVGGVPRQHLEMWAFYLAWLLAFVHAGWRPRKAWAEQCLAIAALAIGAVALNWSTTGDHPLRALGRGVPGVAGMDGVLLVAACLALAIRRRLSHAPGLPKEQPAFADAKGDACI
jgi:uncharacterized iron-regulated membrane protein